MSTCERCQGNGEIVTDWERYLSPQKGDDGDEAVTECPDCGGEGVIDMNVMAKDLEIGQTIMLAGNASLIDGISYVLPHSGSEGACIIFVDGRDTGVQVGYEELIEIST